MIPAGSHVSGLPNQVASDMNDVEGLSSKVEDAISASPHVNSRQLRFEAEHGCVRLLGTVTTYYQKQMAQEAVRRLDGVTQIENELEVSYS